MRVNRLLFPTVSRVLALFAIYGHRYCVKSHLYLNYLIYRTTLIYIVVLLCGFHDGIYTTGCSYRELI